MAARVFGARVLSAWLWISAVAHAEPPAGVPLDRPAAAAPRAAEAHPEPKPLRWRETTLTWQHQATTQTLGIGADYQSDNPLYEWVFYFRPRYYLWEDADTTLSLRLQMQAGTELTNNDVTTRRGEFLLEDSVLSLAPEFILAGNGEELTVLTLSTPRLVLPTSKASRASGTILEAGARAYLEQTSALRRGEPLLPRGALGVRIGYGYLFSRSIVPESTDLNQVRTDLDGRSVSNDQLGGAALAQHRAVLRLRASADLWRDRVSLFVEGGVDPAWKYALAGDARVCNVATGCVAPEQASDQRFGVVTFLNAELSARVVGDILSLAAGYENIAPDLGPDGQRRSPFWSPGAKLYIGLELALDALYSEMAREPNSPEVAAIR